MNDKLKNVVVTIAFVFIIVIFFIANIIKKDDTISIAERRKLEQFPQISAKTVFNGTFFNKFNKYTTDQFVLREEFRKTNQKVWSNLTISIKNDRITYTFCYDNLLGGQDEYYDHHIFWRNKYLHIEPHSRKEKNAIEQYIANRRPSRKKDEEYDSGIYQKRQTNIITYETTDFKETQKVEYLATKQEKSKIKNQILCNK